MKYLHLYALSGCFLLIALPAFLHAQESEYLNAGSAQPGWEPLPLELPPPLFVGTPKDIVTPNLEPVTGKNRKPFLAPKGIKNVALGKPVSSSAASTKVGTLKQLTDGDKRGSDGSFIEIDSGVQYFQIDLGAPQLIHAILLWHYHMEARVYYDAVVKTSDDPDFITNVKTLFNNDHDNSAGLGVGKDKEYIETNEGKLIEGNGAKARYLRFYTNGNTSNNLNHAIEVEVYAQPAP